MSAAAARPRLGGYPDKEDEMATTTEPAPRTGAAQGELWSERAEDWAALQEPCMRPLHEAGLDALEVGEGTSLLDAGCGSGQALSIAAARGAHVSGLDAAPGLLAIARPRVPDARIEQGDLEELPFADRSFDAVSGFNSFQYAASPEAALVEAYRVLQPGGRLVVATWGPPELCDLAANLAAVGRLLPPPPAGAPGPFALSGDGALAALLARAGFEPYETRDVVCRFDYADDAHAARAMISSGPCIRALRHAGEETVRAALLESVASLRTPTGSYRIANTFRFVLARRGDAAVG
jgi:SAM-dependent methyltransferase